MTFSKYTPLELDSPDSSIVLEKDPDLTEAEDADFLLESQEFQEAGYVARLSRAVRRTEDISDRVRTYIKHPKEILIDLSVLLDAVRRYTTERESTTTDNKLRSTAWLDGVRGLASFFVYIYHSSYEWGFGGGGTAFLGDAWRQNPAADNWWRLPFIRLVYGSGSLMVAVFFIISGFVLTQKGLSQIRSKRYSKILETVSSAAFRRTLRIWLPFAVVSALHVTVLRFGIGFAHRIILEKTNFEQVQNWAKELNRVMNPFVYFDHNQIAASRYGRSSWTLPLEVYGSFVCYTLLIIMARMDRFIARTIVLIFVTLWATYNQAWHIFLFLVGMIFADYDLEMSERLTAFHRFRASKQSLSYCWTAAWSVVLMYGLWIGGWPETHGPHWDHHLSGIWWLNFAACLIMISLYHLPWVRGLFDTAPIQYLGRLSFGMYLCHFPVLDLMSVPYLRPWIRAHISVTHCNMVAFTIDTVALFVLSHGFERWIDKPSVQFAKYLENLFVSKPAEQNVNVMQSD